MTVAVAANFKTALDQLETDFEARTDYELETVIGSTGKLYAQIIYGAPYDVFLAADQERPIRLVEEDQALADSRYTYALGRLILLGTDDPTALASSDIKRIAIANPSLAPYGIAAEQILRQIDLNGSTQSKLVLGENVGQAFAFVRTGNAQVGFVSEAQMRSLDANASALFWRPSPDLYDPIAQDAVLLNRGAENSAALAFMTYLQTDAARDIIARNGYDLP